MFPHVRVLHRFVCCIRRIRYKLSGDSDFFVASLQWNLRGSRYRKKKAPCWVCRVLFVFWVERLTFERLKFDDPDLERKDHVATDSGLASCEVFVEAVAIFVPDPANFWTEQKVCVGSVVHTGRVVVQIIVLNISEA